MVQTLFRRIIVAACAVATLCGVLTLAHFPWDVDGADIKVRTASKRFYDEAYAPTGDKIAYPAAQAGLPSQSNYFVPISEFLASYGLQNKRVLEIGAGAGGLQDVARDYVGLDIAEAARIHFHKPFVQGSATDLPFADSQFDVILTVYTLEHVPNPETALNEMRRVVKDGGYIYIAPAWDVPWWRSRGYDMRPWSDLDLRGKVVSAFVAPVQRSLVYTCLYRIPAHAIRSAWWHSSASHPTVLRYKRLTPDYEHFWGPDSDAVNSLDAFEAALWYRSRGDECLNCASGLHQIVRTWGHPLIILVHKGAGSRQ